MIGSTASCGPLNPSSAATNDDRGHLATRLDYSSYGKALRIKLTNNPSFTPTGTTTANTVPTSIVIVGQVGSSLGTQRTTGGGVRAGELVAVCPYEGAPLLI